MLAGEERQAKPSAKQKMLIKMLSIPFCAYLVQIFTTSWLLAMSAFLGAWVSSLMFFLINSTALLAPVVTACIDEPVNQNITHPPRMKPNMEYGFSRLSVSVGLMLSVF